MHWITKTEPKADDTHAQALLSHPNVQLWSKVKVECVNGDASGVSGHPFNSNQRWPRPCPALAPPDSLGDTSQVTSITLIPRIGNPVELPVEGVFVYGAGSKPITDFLEDKLDVNEGGGVIVDEGMATSEPGVFAIGDIRNRPHKQVVVAAADGCIAAMSVDRYLSGRDSFRVDWKHK